MSLPLFPVFTAYAIQIEPEQTWVAVRDIVAGLPGGTFNLYKLQAFHLSGAISNWIAVGDIMDVSQQSSIVLFIEISPLGKECVSTGVINLGALIFWVDLQLDIVHFGTFCA